MALNHELIENVNSFLDNASTTTKAVYCSDCGTRMKHLNSTFAFNGESWGIPLPFCPKCTADVPQWSALLRRAS
jgi:hypothetical protein